MITVTLPHTQKHPHSDYTYHTHKHTHRIIHSLFRLAVVRNITACAVLDSTTARVSWTPVDLPASVVGSYTAGTLHYSGWGQWEEETEQYSNGIIPCHCLLWCVVRTSDRTAVPVWCLCHSG